MSQPQAPLAPRFWVQLVARSVVVGVAAVAVTFSSDHSPLLGLTVLAGVAVALSVIAFVGSRSVVATSRLRRVAAATGAAYALVGLGAAAALAAPSLIAFVVAAASLGLTAGVAELLLVSERSAGLPAAADRRILAAVAFLMVVGVLLSGGNSVVAVGVFGAWAAVTAVFSLITAFSLKWESGRPQAPVEIP